MSTFKCLCCNKNYHKQVEENLKKNFVNINKFSNHDISKFIMFLRKSVYPYQYMDDWEKFNEASLPDKVDYYSHLNMEDITDAYYTHTKRACNFELEILENLKNSGGYQDLLIKAIHYC